MKVLVTGGAGYIGSHACKVLKQSGYEPVVLDSLVRGNGWAVKWGPLYEGSIADQNLVEDILRKEKIEAVMHFSAFCYVGESVHNPEMYFTNNVSGTLSLLQVMKEMGVSNFVFSSTCATYGDPVEVPMTERHPQNPVNPYGRSKLMVEQILRDFVAAYGFKVASLRYFNAAGTDPDGEIGEVHEPETHLIPLALKVLTGERKDLTIFGTDYDTPDGTCIRDYIHVTDLTKAHLLALEKLKASSDGVFEAFNLGSGNGFSVKEIIDTVERVTGKKVNTKVGARRAGDPPRLVANSSFAESELGWQRPFSDIETIVKTAWQWESEGRLKVL